MLPTTKRGSRAEKRRLGFSVYEQMRDAGAQVSASERIREWINNSPEAAGLSPRPGKRKAFRELENHRGARSEMGPKKARNQDKETECRVHQQKNMAQDRSTQRSTRSATRVILETRTAVPDEDDKPPIEQESYHLGDLVAAQGFLAPRLSMPPLVASISHSLSRSHESSSSPSKSGTQRTRSTSPTKGISVERLRSYKPEMKFSSYGVAKDEDLLTTPVKTL